MYGTSKIEAIPLSNRGAGVDQGPEPEIPIDSEPSSGRLFVPPQKRNKRIERNPNPAVSSKYDSCNWRIVLESNDLQMFKFLYISNTSNHFYNLLSLI